MPTTLSLIPATAFAKFQDVNYCMSVLHTLFEPSKKSKIAPRCGNRDQLCVRQSRAASHVGSIYNFKVKFRTDRHFPESSWEGGLH